ncbi:hypothetical protein [Corynebacterium argentoratense]|nr:hypothetical protein [Corynebacterium argentoratense]
MRNDSAVQQDVAAGVGLGTAAAWAAVVALLAVASSAEVCCFHGSRSEQ